VKKNILIARKKLDFGSLLILGNPLLCGLTQYCDQSYGNSAVKDKLKGHYIRGRNFNFS